MLTPKIRFVRACLSQEVDRPPVWLMRQAGRYLPEYQVLRKKYSTKIMMQTPEIASDITVQPVNIIGVDAAILYSDILMIPDAMGMGLDFIQGEGPRFEFSIDNESSFDRLNTQNVCARLDYVFKTIQLTLKKLPPDFPLIGFAGAPFTVACYMIAGRGKQDFSFVKNWASENPRLFHSILETLTQITVEYLLKQADAGVCAVQLFDTWAGLLSVDEYNVFAKPYTEQIFARLRQEKIPIIHFVKSAKHLLGDMLELSNNVVSVGNDVRLCDVYEKKRDKQQAVQGNLDPKILLTNKETIKDEVKKMLSEVPNLRRGYIANLGHGVLPETPVENVKHYVECAQSLGQAIRG